MSVYSSDGGSSDGEQEPRVDTWRAARERWLESSEPLPVVLAGMMAFKYMYHLRSRGASLALCDAALRQYVIPSVR